MKINSVQKIAHFEALKYSFKSSPSSPSPILEVFQHFTSETQTL